MKNYKAIKEREREREMLDRSIVDDNKQGYNK